MNLIFDLIATLIVGTAIVIGMEVAHDESRYIPIGIVGCFFIALSGFAISGFDVDNHGWDAFPIVLLITLIPAAIGAICLIIWHKDKTN